MKSRRRRRGVSILEVIFAILVTTIGLLAALTVFPVAAHLARKGRIADETAISGKAAFHAFDTRGGRRPFIIPNQPGGWMAWNVAANSGSGDFQQFTPIPFASYCIDPRFMAVNGTPATAVAASAFPYHNAAPGPRMLRLTMWSGQVTPLGAVMPDAAAPNNDPIEMSKAQADSIFMFTDDLTLERPASGSLPGFGTFVRVDHDNDGPTGTAPISSVRNTGGHLSWMATLTPKHELYAAPAIVQNDTYVLSIVVFHDRPLVDFTLDPAPAAPPPGTPPDASESMYNLAERVVAADFADAGGTGYAGGETVFIWPPNGVTVADTAANRADAARMLKVRAGDWIMLSGFAPRWVIVGGTPTVLVDVPVFHWYRVTEADHEPYYHPGENHYEVAVSLAGPDWDISIDQQATIVTGVVGVYEKTVRLETGVGF